MIVQGVVDNNVWPPRMGVTVRVWNLYAGLARRSEVSRVAVTSVIKSREQALAHEVRDGIAITRVKPWHPTVFAWLERAGVSPLFLVADAYRHMPALVAHAFDKGADVLQVDSLNLTPLLAQARPGALKVYGAQNVESEWFERVGPRLARPARWAGRLAALEREALAMADLVVAVSAADKEQFVTRYGVNADKIAVVDNGFDATRLRMPTPDEKRGAREALGLAADERGLLFLGTDFEHNRRAAEALFEAVVPGLDALPARLFIVGGVGGRFAARALAEGGGRVRAVPEQSDLTPYLWGCDIGLNPVTTGAGSNVKLPTYLAAGLDVLSTPFGLRGFEALSAYALAAEAGDFGTALRDRPFPARTGRDEALAAYTWQAQADRMFDAYRTHGVSA